MGSDKNTTNIVIDTTAIEYMALVGVYSGRIVDGVEGACAR